MLSNAAINAFSLSMSLSIGIKSSPFNWNRETLRLQTDDSRLTKTLFTLSTLFALFHAGFVTVRAFKSILIDAVSPVTFMLQLTLMFQCFLSVVMQSNTFFRREEMADFMTMLFKIERRLTDTFQTGKVRDTCGPFLWILSTFNFVQIFGVAFLFLTHPNNNVFYFSLTYFKGGPWKYAFMPLEVFPYAICWLNALPYSGTAIMFIASTSFWLQEMQLKRNSVSASTAPSLRSVPNVLLVYRNFQLMMNRFNDMVNFSAMQGHKILNLFLSIGGLYGTFTFYNRLPLQAYVTFPMVASACIMFARMVYPYGKILNGNAEEFRRFWNLSSSEISTESEHNDMTHGFQIVTVETMRTISPNSIFSRNERSHFESPAERIRRAAESKAIRVKYLLKHLRSCRDLKCQMGIFYYFEKSTAVTFIYIAVDYAIMLLLSVDDYGFH